jgi:MFS family permease
MTAQSYRLTTVSCFLGIFVQAVASNITAVLFIPLMTLYDLSYIHLGILVAVNFSTQVGVDLVVSAIVDRFGFRRLILPAGLLAAVGLVLFALSPLLFDSVLVGMILSTIIFSAACGLSEVLLSPIVNAIPHDEKGPAMTLMHSFYAWGQVATILVTTLFLFVFGIERWQVIVMIWAVVPLVNFFMFLAAPFPGVVPEEHRQTMRDLLFRPFYLVALLAILAGASTELVMAQWASTFAERALALPKITGDLYATAGFAVMLGVGRVLYGAYGARIQMHNVLVNSAAAGVVCYVIAALSPYSSLSLAACAVCGLAASLLWPGTLVVTAARYPLAGAWMFAILAAAGDVGAALGPFVTGLATDQVLSAPAVVALSGGFGLTAEQFAIRAGILLAALFPLVTLACHIWLRRAAPVAVHEAAPAV